MPTEAENKHVHDITSCRCKNYTLCLVEADQKTKFQEKKKEFVIL